MSNQPLRENLLSGYLDDQLSPELRAEVETELAKNADLKAQFEILKQQSLQCASIQKFRLDAGFADRVLSDPRTEEVFSAMSDRHGIARGDSIYRSSIPPLRSAAIAILSLAALVLITLFLQNPEAGRDAPALSKRGNKDSATGLETSENAITGNLRSDKSHGFERGNIETNSSKSDRDLIGQIVETEVPPGDIRMFNEQVVSDVPGIKQESGTRDALDEMPTQGLASPSNVADGSEQVDNLRLAGKNPAESENFAKRGTAQIQPQSAVDLDRVQIADATPKATDPSGFNFHGGIAASRPIGGSPANSLQGFIEIKLSGGPDQLVEFHAALNRNQIVINVPAQDESKPLVQLDPSVATNEKSDGSIDAMDVRGIDSKSGRGGIGLEVGGLGEAGGGGRGGGNEPKSMALEQQVQAGSQSLGDAISPAADSQLFLITASPQQMVGLIGELRNSAAISGYQMPELDVQPEMERSSLGIAQSVERQMELRGENQEQFVPSSSRDSKNSLHKKGLESSQRENDQTDVDTLYRYFATQAGEIQDRNSQARQYLLFVNPQNSAMAENEKSESTIAKPVPADASELKK